MNCLLDRLLSSDAEVCYHTDRGVPAKVLLESLEHVLLYFCQLLICGVDDGADSINRIKADAEEGLDSLKSFFLQDLGVCLCPDGKLECR